MNSHDDEVKHHARGGPLSKGGDADERGEKSPKERQASASAPIGKAMAG